MEKKVGQQINDIREKDQTENNNEYDFWDWYCETKPAFYGKPDDNTFLDS